MAENESQSDYQTQARIFLRSKLLGYHPPNGREPLQEDVRALAELLETTRKGIRMRGVHGFCCESHDLGAGECGCECACHGPWGICIAGGDEEENGWYTFVNGSNTGPKLVAESVARNLNNSRAPEKKWVCEAKPYPINAEKHG